MVIHYDIRKYHFPRSIVSIGPIFRRHSCPLPRKFRSLVLLSRVFDICKHSIRVTLVNFYAYFVGCGA